MQNIENQTPEKETPFRMRCPQCYKLFHAFAEAIDHPHPQFECSQCHTQFWVPFPEALEFDEVVGLTYDEITSFRGHAIEKSGRELAPTVANVPKETFKCKKCGTPFEGGEKICQKCEVIHEKVKKLPTFPLSRQNEGLMRLWSEVKSSYTNKDLHQDFIEAARQTQALEFAAQSYRIMLELDPSDDIAIDRLKQIDALAMSGLPSSTERPHKNSFKGFNWTLIPIFLSSMVLVAGFVLHGFQNLAGVGAAMLFLSLALRLYFKR